VKYSLNSLAAMATFLVSFLMSFSQFEACLICEKFSRW